MGRWAPRDLQSVDRLTELHDDVDDLDEEPPAEYFGRQAAAAAYQLRHGKITDPTIRARLERDHAHWEGQLAAATVDEHWDSGAGDRTLF